MLNTHISYELAIPLLDICLRERKHLSNQRLFMNIHTSCIWKQTESNKLINKLWHMNTVFNSSIKSNELLISIQIDRISK
jgi:hypothetical protein